MIQPIRIQLSRAKGFNLQEFSKSINGLPAKKVDRSTKWGNPYKVGYYSPRLKTSLTLDDSLALFEHMLLTKIDKGLVNIEELRGYNLACWCKYEDKCHADIYLRLLY